MILEKLELGPFASNCYIVGDEATREAIIVDPGAEAGSILARVEDLGLTVKYVVLTHGHIDHIGALKEIKEATGAEVSVHSADARSLQGRHPPMFGFSFQPSPPPDRLLKDGDSIAIGSLRFTVLHTPGHSPGGICLQGEGVVFSGDTLFNFSIGRTDMSGGDYDVLLDGIHAKLMVLPDSTTVYPGHGPASTIGSERRWNPFLRA